jgi:uncharacterized protein YkwD
MARRFLIVSLVLVPLLVAPTVASAMGVPEHKAFRLVNAAREQHDLRSLTARRRLMRYAERHSHAMARQQTLFHSSLSIGGYSGLGECVGEGPTIYSVQQAFMASSVHRRIILGSWKWIGIGVVIRDGIRYVTELFAR